MSLLSLSRRTALHPCPDAKRWGISVDTVRRMFTNVLACSRSASTASMFLCEFPARLLRAYPARHTVRLSACQREQSRSRLQSVVLPPLTFNPKLPYISYNRRYCRVRLNVPFVQLRPWPPSSLRLQSYRVAAADLSEENNDNQQRENDKFVSSCSD
jgi:hypothetical protein